ncbi:conserved hypothetical protein [Klebsiella pneumoniae]|nr:conserved hypothetical protein [Klebsiella pneumoniae]
MRSISLPEKQTPLSGVSHYNRNYNNAKAQVVFLGGEWVYFSCCYRQWQLFMFRRYHGYSIFQNE